MKKLTISIIVLLLLILCFFQYKKYTRLNAPNTYDYEINSQIDNHYYDQKMVNDYYNLSYGIGSFAREQWYNYKIDVLYKDNSSTQSKRATITYNGMRAVAKEIESKLLYSAKLKEKGFSNHEIKAMIESGSSEEEFKVKNLIGDTRFKLGDESYGVWKIQKKLNEKGYKSATSGVYDKQTREAVMQFQDENNLMPTGITEKSTLLLLY